MSLRQHQSDFVKKVALLILYAYEIGYELTFGDAYDTDLDGGHLASSYHGKRLAIDFNLFKNGKYLTETEDHQPLGEFWRKIGGTWGGDFKRKDGNHYSYTE